jgi:hypothetical protein
VTTVYTHASSHGGIDAWRRCEIEGCEWHVPLETTPPRCHLHGGRPIAARMTDVMGGTVYAYSGGDLESDSRP